MRLAFCLRPLAGTTGTTNRRHTCVADAREGFTISLRSLLLIGILLSNYMVDRLHWKPVMLFECIKMVLTRTLLHLLQTISIQCCVGCIRGFFFLPLSARHTANKILHSLHKSPLKCFDILFWNVRKRCLCMYAVQLKSMLHSNKKPYIWMWWFKD